MLDQSYYTQVDTILKNYPTGERSLIPVIQDIQEQYGYLPPNFSPMSPKRLAFPKQRHIA